MKYTSINKSANEFEYWQKYLILYAWYSSQIDIPKNSLAYCINAQLERNLCLYIPLSSFQAPIQQIYKLFGIIALYQWNAVEWNKETKANYFTYNKTISGIYPSSFPFARQRVFVHLCKYLDTCPGATPLLEKWKFYVVYIWINDTHTHLK